MREPNTSDPWWYLNGKLVFINAYKMIPLCYPYLDVLNMFHILPSIDECYADA